MDSHGRPRLRSSKEECEDHAWNAYREDQREKKRWKALRPDPLVPVRHHKQARVARATPAAPAAPGDGEVTEH
jgi:hypothetical protein